MDVPSFQPVTDPIDPDEWVILTTITHNGASISRGERVPDDFPAATLQKHERSGAVRRISQPVATPVTKPPETILDYLRGPDAFILQRLIAHPVNPDQLREIRDQAKRANRSGVLISALELALEMIEIYAR